MISPLVEIQNAISNNNEKKALKILQQDNFLETDNFQKPLLFQSADQKMKKLFLQLLKSNIYSLKKYPSYAYITDDIGCSILYYCLQLGFVFGVRVILNDFDKLIEKRQILSSDLKYLKRPCECLDTEADSDYNIFHIAVLANKPKILEILIEHNVDFDAICEEGTPIQLAVKEFCQKSALYLARIQNYNFFQRDLYGFSVLNDCITRDEQQIFTEIFTTIKLNCQNDEQYLKRAIEFINHKGGIGNTLLHEAAQQNNEFYLNYLLENKDLFKIDIEALNDKKQKFNQQRKLYKTKQQLKGIYHDDQELELEYNDIDNLIQSTDDDEDNKIQIENEQNQIENNNLNTSQKNKIQKNQKNKDANFNQK